MDMERLLEQEIRKNEKLLAQLKDYIAKNSKYEIGNKLKCSTSNGVSQYFINGKYISKKKIERIKRLAQLEYSEKVLAKLQDKLDVTKAHLQMLKNNSLDGVYNKLCPGRKKLVIPVAKTKEDFIKEWLEEEYEPYDRWDDVKTEFYTLKGERVRSKAEKMIADELYRANVPYKYEYPLKLLDGKVEKTLRPDFLTLNTRTLNTYIIEHLGMMDNVKYNNYNLNKLDLLERNGHLLGIDLLLFHETSDNPVSIPTIRRYIDEYLI